MEKVPVAWQSGWGSSGSRGAIEAGRLVCHGQERTRRIGLWAGASRKKRVRTRRVTGAYRSGSSIARDPAFMDEGAAWRPTSTRHRARSLIPEIACALSCRQSHGQRRVLRDPPSTRDDREREWWCRDTAANPSPAEIPVLQGIYRESMRIQPLADASRPKLAHWISQLGANSLRTETGNYLRHIRELFRPTRESDQRIDAVYLGCRPPVQIRGPL